MEVTREREETEEGGGGEMFTQAPGADASANVAETPAPEGTATSHDRVSRDPLSNPSKLLARYQVGLEP